jgi:predicted O-methyltransferase YrrM
MSGVDRGENGRQPASERASPVGGSADAGAADGGQLKIQNWSIQTAIDRRTVITLGYRSVAISDKILSVVQSHLVGAEDDWSTNKGRITYPSRAQVLELAVALSRPVPGNIVEFGTWEGHSTRVIRDELWRARVWERAQRRKRIFACDSFEGLAEDYEHFKAGTFATEVPTLRGVRIVKGFFEDSLTPELSAEVGRVSFAHLDADLYSSTLKALNWLTPLLQPGSILLFDELLGEDPAEARALVEWQEASGTRLAMLALFGREPIGFGERGVEAGRRTDRRGLFQVVGDTELRKAPPLFPVRLRRRLAAKW